MSSACVPSAPKQNRKCSLSQDTTRNLLVCLVWVLKNVDVKMLKQWWLDLSPNKLNLLLEALYYCIFNFEYKVSVCVMLSNMIPLNEQSE